MITAATIVKSTMITGDAACGDRQPERQDAEPGGDEHLVAEQAVG